MFKKKTSESIEIDLFLINWSFLNIYCNESGKLFYLNNLAFLIES